MKKRFINVMIALMLSCLFMGCGSAYENKPYTNQQVVFGAHALSVTLYGRKSPEAFREMAARLSAINAEISLTEPDSPVSHFNEHTQAGERVEVGYHAYRLTELSQQYYAETGGAFNIAIGASAALWHTDALSAGYFAGKPVDFDLPSYADVSLKNTAYAFFKDTDTPFGLRAIAENGTYYLEKLADGIKIDFGAIAKGYAADVCADIAAEYGLKGAVIDVARNIKVYGQAMDADAKPTELFHITVAAPRPRPVLLAEETLCAVSVSGGQSVVVSGDYQRFYRFPLADAESLPVCHIMDPFTGMPLGVTYADDRYLYRPDGVISVMIEHENSARADAFTTAACVLTFDAAQKLLTDYRLKGMIMTESKIAFMGYRETELYRADVFNRYAAYGAANISFTEYA